MRILGIDPGYSTIGWAVIENDLRIVSFGTLETSSGTKIEERLLKVHNALNDILVKFQPDCAAIETIFFSRNTKTAIDVAKCIGVIMLTIRVAGIEICEYNPSQIKLAITGYGKADKSQIQHMIMKIYRINNIPEPDDAADALAIATCHSLKINHTAKLHNG